jgi:hypothetical protein
MIQLARQASIGESLSAYAFARILAVRFGYAFHAPLRAFPGTLLPLRGEQMIGQRELWNGHWPFDLQSGRKLEPQEFHEAPGRPVFLQGKFQRWDLMAEMREVIQQDWLQMGNPLSERPSDEFVVCLEPATFQKYEREEDSDARQRKWTDERLAFEAKRIRELAQSVSHQHLFLAVDELEHPLLPHLTDLRAEVVSVQGLEEFAFLHSFQKLALSQSAGQWWAAFLGRAREIYFPSLETGIWSHPAPADLAHEPEWYGIDLRVLDDPRFIYAA